MHCPLCGVNEKDGMGHACIATPAKVTILSPLTISTKGAGDLLVAKDEEISKLKLQNQELQKFSDGQAETLRRVITEREDAKRLNVSLQNALREMLKMYPASTFCDVDCSTVSPCEHCAQEMAVLLLIEKRIDEGPVCTMCGWCNCSNHGGGSRKMYTMGTVTKCGECLPTTR